MHQRATNAHDLLGENIATRSHHTEEHAQIRVAQAQAAGVGADGNSIGEFKGDDIDRHELKVESGMIGVSAT